MTEERPKICAECKWCNFDSERLSIMQHLCTHPQLRSPDYTHLVTGELVRTPFPMCHHRRYREDGLCGYEGKLWEPKSHASPDESKSADKPNHLQKRWESILRLAGFP